MEEIVYFGKKKIVVYMRKNLRNLIPTVSKKTTRKKNLISKTSSSKLGGIYSKITL